MRGAEVKQHIVETASALFYQNGYNSTGINEIIDEAGIAKATLYNHFKSKEEICLAYLNHKNHTFIQEIKEYCTQKKGGKAQILGLFDFLLVFFMEKDFNGCWCIKTVAEIPQENTKIRKAIKQHKEDFLVLIESLVKSHVIHGRSKSLARQIYLLYESAVAESHLHQEDWPIKENRKLCSLILK